MTAGIESSKRQLAEILKRVEVLEKSDKVPRNERNIAYKTAPDTMDRFAFPSSKLDEGARQQSIEVNSIFKAKHSYSFLLLRIGSTLRGQTHHQTFQTMNQTWLLLQSIK